MLTLYDLSANVQNKFHCFVSEFSVRSAAGN
jgi:hypothetical protein